MHDKAISELIGAAAAVRSAGALGKVCLITGELAGPDHNGGIGTTNRALGLLLRNYGFEVDILYTRVDAGLPFSGRGTFAQHVTAFRKFGVRLNCIDNPGNWSDWQAKSYFALRHLLRHKYRLVFFDDTHGNAYYPLLARRTGNAALSDTIMCVTAHSATQWIYDLNQTPLSTIEEVRLMEMERRSIELADAVKAPSAYILKKYRSYGWTIPENSIVLPNFLPRGRPSRRPTKVAATTAGGSRGAAAPVSELVFFGRLETRKGLWMFCRTLDLLKYRLRGKTITFLGKATVEDGVSTAERLIRWSAGWPFKINLISNFDQEQALNYLRGPGRLAVLPSPEDNSPSVVLECLTEGIPFIACSGSGGEELLDDKTRAANLFAPSVENLSAKLLEVLENGGVTGRASFDEAQLHESFAKWVEGLIAPAERKAKRRGSLSTRKPTLIVLVPAEIAAREVVAEAVRTIEAFGGLIDIEILAADAASVRFELANAEGHLPVNVNHISDFAKVALSLATRDPSIVALCHVTQMLSPDWIERAEVCFASQDDISALTGMAGAPDERGVRVREPYFSFDADAPVVKNYVMGNARALFPLAQETNSGFVVLRSELLAILAEIAPLDPEYARLKRMGDWIHELLVALHLHGKHFELVPDLVAPHSVRETPFELFRLGHYMRSLSSKMFGYAPGSDQQMLSQLAIDYGMAREQAAANALYLEHVSEKLGYREIKPSLYRLDGSHTAELAAVAHANGQIELATELAAKAVMKDEEEKDMTLGDFVRQQADAVNLAEEIAANNFKRLNLEHDYSFRFDHQKQVIELHANSVDKGLAAVVYPSVDLSKAGRFTCVTKVRKGANPVRFRVELLTADKAARWSAEKVVVGGEERPWQVEIPADVRHTCGVVIGIEMADTESASTGAFASWLNPRFVPKLTSGK